MTNGDIPDSSITASSYHHHVDYDREPQYARLGGNKAWASAINDMNPWIQVDLVSNHTVFGLQIARGLHHKIVEQIKVEVGVSEMNLSFVLDNNGRPKVCLNYCFV